MHKYCLYCYNELHKIVKKLETCKTVLKFGGGFVFGASIVAIGVGIGMCFTGVGIFGGAGLITAGV